MGSVTPQDDLDRRCGLLLSHLVHEIRNPLASLSAACRLLSRAAERPDMMAAARDALDRQIEQLAQLMKELSDAAQAARGLVNAKAERYDISSVAAAAIRAARPAIEQRRATLVVNSPEASFHILGDAEQTSKALALIFKVASNALKEQGTMHVTVSRENDHVRISVRQDGTGIPQSVLPDLLGFLPPVNAEPHTSGAAQGFELPVASRLLSMQNGSLAVYSDGLEYGSEFVMRLEIGRWQGDANPFAVPT